MKHISDLCHECEFSQDPTVCVQKECIKLCYHMYSCSRQCYDYSNGHICKHIHRVHSLNVTTQLSESQPESTHYFVDEMDNDPLSFVESVRDNSKGILVFMQRCYI